MSSVRLRSFRQAGLISVSELTLSLSKCPSRFKVLHTLLYYNDAKYSASVSDTSILSTSAVMEERVGAFALDTASLFSEFWQENFAGDLLVSLELGVVRVHAPDLKGLGLGGVALYLVRLGANIPWALVLWFPAGLCSP